MSSVTGSPSGAQPAAPEPGRAAAGRLSLAERDRRWKALDEEMRAAGLDALVVVAADKRGQKGPLRYVADYDLAGRHGYAVLAPGAEPVCVLPQSMAGLPRGPWIEDFRFVLDTAAGLSEALRALPSLDRVGVVGRDLVMGIGEYGHLREELPGTSFIDASALFDRVRAYKSEEEIRGLREAAWIADQCHARLLEVVRPGMTERALNAALLAEMARLGGEDPIFLIMSERPNAAGNPAYRVPRDEIVSATELLMFSIELVGPTGYWVELCRMVTFAPVSGAQRRTHQAVVSAIEAGRSAMQPGTALADVQRAITKAAGEHGTRPGYWSGHSIGHDVIEEAWIGLGLVQSDDVTQHALTHVNAQMAFALHPWLVPEVGRPIGYMSETYVIGEDGAEPLSRYPLDLVTLS